MMKLHWSPRSPFVRKVMITLHETGLTDSVERVRTIVALQMPPDGKLLADNPLGKIPTLITEGGQLLFDSRVICEYLDGRAGTDLFPADPDVRFQHLRWQMLGDGLTDILLLWRTELTREQGAWLEVTQGWHSKVQATMAALEADAGALAETAFGIGHISITCALGQLDFRWRDCQWRDRFPHLRALHDSLSLRSSIAANPVIDDLGQDGPDVTFGQLTFAGIETAVAPANDTKV